MFPSLNSINLMPDASFLFAEFSASSHFIYRKNSIALPSVPIHLLPSGVFRGDLFAQFQQYENDPLL